MKKHYVYLLGCLLLCLLFGWYVASAQSPTRSDSTVLTTLSDVAPPPPANDPEAPATIDSALSWPEIWLACGVLFFGLVLILIEFIYMKQLNINADNSVRLITVTLIIVSVLFLIVSSYDDSQIAPATGLLGTIAGYLLGKTNSTTDKPA